VYFQNIIFTLQSSSSLHSNNGTAFSINIAIEAPLTSTWISYINKQTMITIIDSTVQTINCWRRSRVLNFLQGCFLIQSQSTLELELIRAVLDWPKTNIPTFKCVLLVDLRTHRKILFNNSAFEDHGCTI